jgi:hypothetical protein
MSWWWREQGLDPVDTSALTREQVMEKVLAYWTAVGQGWSPHVPEAQWIGPHHPFDSSDDRLLEDN